MNFIYQTWLYPVSFFFFLLKWSTLDCFLCLPVLPYLMKQCIHRNGALGIPKIILIAHCWLDINSYPFWNNIDVCFMLLSLSKLFMQNKTIWRINCNVDVISYVPQLCKPVQKELCISLCDWCYLLIKMTSSLSQSVWSL